MAAFVPASSLKVLSTATAKHLPPSVLPTSMDGMAVSSSVLSMSATTQLIDFSAEALGFFNDVRIPSALIAGSSLGAVFSLVALANKSRRELPRVDVIILRLYHIFAMASLVLSLNVVVMSTVASTTLLLDHHDTLALSAYQFLNREMRYEFVITRWSFLMSILCFLVGITNRALLEFNLLKPPRRRFGICLILCMTSLLAHLVSFINETLYCWGSLTSMTMTVINVSPWSIVLCNNAPSFVTQIVPLFLADLPPGHATKEAFGTSLTIIGFWSCFVHTVGFSWNIEITARSWQQFQWEAVGARIRTRPKL